MRAFLLGVSLLAGLAGAAPAQTLDAVKARGTLQCGVAGTLPGFSAPDAQGAMRGIDADICRAVAAAVLGDAEKVTFVRASSPLEGLGALERRDFDLMVRNTTVTVLRDTARGVTPTAVYFYDGQGILIRRDAGVSYFSEMGGKRVCVSDAGVNQSAAVLRDAQRRLGIEVTLVEAGRRGVDLFDAFKAGRCDAVSTDAAALAALRTTELPDPDSVTILPDRLTREPLAAWVRNGDEAWRAIVTWTIHALVAAEELEISSGNLEQALTSQSDEVRLLLGLDQGPGRAMHLEDTWAAQAIRQVGNYAEIFNRNLGEGSPINLDRGLNDQWRRGGLLYAPPFR
jgi:general L-amino acid transport system substrate-binding protein